MCGISVFGNKTDLYQFLHRLLGQGSNLNYADMCRKQCPSLLLKDVLFLHIHPSEIFLLLVARDSHLTKSVKRIFEELVDIASRDTYASPLVNLDLGH